MDTNILFIVLHTDILYFIDFISIQLKTTCV